MVIHFLCQLSNINSCDARLFHRINHKLFHFFGIIFQNYLNTGMISLQFKIIQILNKSRQRTITIISHVKIGIFFHKGTSNFTKSRIFSIVFVCRNNFQNSIRNFLFGNGIFLFFFIFSRLKMNIKIAIVKKNIIIT